MPIPLDLNQFKLPAGQAPAVKPQIDLSKFKIQTPEQKADAASAEQYGASFPNKTESGAKNFLNIPRAVGNLPSSMIKFIENLGTAVIHPIRTVEGLGRAAIGAGEAIGNKIRHATDPYAPDFIPDKNEEAFNNLKEALYTRYGNIDNLQRSSVNDPFGIGSDVFAILSGGGALADTFTGASKTNSAINAANKVATAEEAAGIPAKVGVTGAIDSAIPKVASIVTKPVSKLVSGTGKLATQILGAETGAGASSVESAYNAGKTDSTAFTDAMRGKTNAEDVVQTAQDAVQNITDARRSDYVEKLKGISQNTKSMDITPIKDSVTKGLENFGVKINKDGTLDFSRSSIANNGSARADIQGVYDTVKNWGTQAGDRTPIGIDTLKKQLGDFYSPSGSARAFVQSVKSTVSKILKDQVSGYSDMTKAYEQSSNLLDDIKSATGVGGRAKVDTVFTKLTNAMKNDNQLRLEIIGQMTEAGDQAQLIDKIAGVNMKSFIPRGMVGKGLDIGAIYGLFKGILSVKAIPLILSTSPRVVGEFVRTLGIGAKYANKLSEMINAASKLVPNVTPAVRVRQLEGKETSGIINNAQAAEINPKDNTLLKMNSIPSTQIVKDQIAFRESKGDYQAVNHGNSNGTIDLGKYQINEATLKSYAKKFLGRDVSEEEFLSSPELQEKFMEKEIEHLKSLGVKKFDTLLALHHLGWGDVSTERINKIKNSSAVKKYLANKPK